MSSANYNGKQANNTSYIKNFVYGVPANLWKTTTYTKSNGVIVSAITPKSTNINSLYIPGDLFVDGSLINPSDINIKKNITTIDETSTYNIMHLCPSSFSFKDDAMSTKHYGFIAQDFEKYYPELVQNKPDTKYSNIKSINYLEIIPLLVSKIQMMQKEIDELKSIHK
jgi:hypothetical protein